MKGHFSCVIQDESVAVESTDRLAGGLQSVHAKHYPGEDASISWRTVPTGWMFTEGRQSSSSIIGCVVQHQTTLEERERYMRDVCDLWTSVTGCTDHEVVVALTEADPLD